MAIEKYALKAVLEFEDKLSPKMVKTIRRLHELERRVRRVSATILRFVNYPLLLAGKAFMKLGRQLGRLILKIPGVAKALQFVGATARRVGLMFVRVMNWAANTAFGRFVIKTVAFGAKIVKILGGAFLRVGIVAGKGMAKATQAMYKLVSTASSVGKKVYDTFKGYFLGLGGAIAGFLGLGVKWAADMEQINIALTSITGSSEKARKELEMLKKFALRTPFEIKGLSEVYTNLRAAGLESERAMRWIERMGDTLSALGRTDAFNNMMINMVQILQRGKAEMIDIKQMMNANIPILQALAKALGKTEAQIQDMISEGKIGIKEIEAAFEVLAGEGGKFYKAMDKQSRSLKGRWDAFKESIAMTAAEIVQSTGLFDALGKALEKISNWVDENKDDIVNFVEDLKNKASDLWNKLEPIRKFVSENKDELMEFGKIVGIVAGAFFVWGAAVALVTSPLFALMAIILAISAVVYLLKKAWETNFGGIRDIVQRVVDWFKKFAIPAWKKEFEFIWWLLKWLWGKFDWVFKIIWEIVKGALDTIWGVIKAGFELVKGTIETILSAISGNWSQAWESMKDTFKGILDAIIGIFESWKNRALNIINTVKDKINPKKWAEGVGDWFNRTVLRRRASGGFASGLTLVGEQGPELVMLPRGSRVVSNTSSRGNVPGGIQIIVNGDLGTRDAVRQIIQEEVIPLLKLNNFGKMTLGI